jgi:hypothetical protein
MNKRLELLNAAAVTLEAATQHLKLGNFHESQVLLEAAGLLVGEVTRLSQAL